MNDSSITPEPRPSPGEGGLLLRNFSLSLTSKLVSLAGQVVYVMMTARLFPKEDVAVLAVAGITTMLMDVVKGLGLGTMLLKRLPQFGPADGEEARTLVRTYLFYSLLPPLALALAGILLPDAARHFLFRASARRDTFQMGLLMSMFTVLSNSNILVLQASQRFGQLAALTMLTAGLPRVGPCLAAGFLGAELETFLEWSVAAAALAFGATCWPLRSYFRGRWVPLLTREAFWSESRHYYFTALLRYGATQVDQLLVAALFPPATLAVYYMLRRLYSIGVVLIGSMIDALVPDLSQQAVEDLAGARKRLAEWSRISIFAGSTGAAVLAGNGSAVIALLLGPSYGEDSLLIALFAASTALYFLYCLVQVDLMLFHESDKVLWMAAATAAANLVGGPAVAPWLGVHSIPLAMLGGYLFGLAAARWKNSRVTVPRPVWRIRELAIGLAVVTLASAAPLVARHLLPDGPWERVVAINLLITALAVAHCWQSRVGDSLRRLVQTAG